MAMNTAGGARGYLEKLDGEKVLAGCAVHEMLENRAHDGFVGELTTFRHRHMNKDGPGLYSVKNGVSISHVEPIAAFAQVHLGR